MRSIGPSQRAIEHMAFGLLKEDPVYRHSTLLTISCKEDMETTLSHLQKRQLETHLATVHYRSASFFGSNPRFS